MKDESTQSCNSPSISSERNLIHDGLERESSTNSTNTVNSDKV